MSVPCRSGSCPHCGANIVEHFGRNRPKQEPAHRPAASRRHHHQIGTVMLYGAVDRGGSFALLREDIHMLTPKCSDSEVVETLYFLSTRSFHGQRKLTSHIGVDE